MLRNLFFLLLGFGMALAFGAHATIQGLDLSSANSAITGPLTVANGGTGASSAGATAVGNISGGSPVSCPSGVTAATVVVVAGIVTHC